MDASDIISVVSLVISAAIVGFYMVDRRLAKYAIENDYAKDLLRWHGEIVTVLAALGCGARAGTTDRRVEQCAQLSALIEQGRFFFPNIDRHDGFGLNKPTAYRGYRNLALDFLVAIHNIHSSTAESGSIDQANTLQRHFTSIVFEVVRPERRLKRLRAMTDHYFVQEKSFEDFLDHEDAAAIEAIWRKPS